MISEESEADLLERAEVEEKKYNWIEAAKLYERAANSFLDKNMIKEAAETKKKLGYAYMEAAHTVETTEEFIEFNNRTVNAFKEATNFFKKTEDKPEELECKAMALFISATFKNSILDAKNLFNESYELLMKANELHSKKNNYEITLTVKDNENNKVSIKQNVDIYTWSGVADLRRPDKGR